ncbi:MAG: hypothetical protein E6J80_09565, partial [Deltaproteobacteria bacterium]
MRSRATRPPADHSHPATRWRLEARAAVLDAHARARAMRRSTLWRVLDEADRTPPRWVSGRHSPDPACEAQARDRWALSGHAWRFDDQGRLGLCGDEQTGRPMLQRPPPTPFAQPGKPEQREQADSRQGGRVFSASGVVPPGQGRWPRGPTRTREDLAAHLAHVKPPRPAMARDDWVVENLQTPWSL